MVTDRTVGIATGIAATVSTSAELQQGQDRLAAIDSKADDDGDQDQREDNQVVADLQHGFLEMADGDRRLHQFRGLAEVGFAARRIDQRADFAATDDRTGEHGVAGFARGGQQLSGQRRLVHGYLVAVQQARIGRHDVAQAQADGVARHQFTRRRVDPLAVAFHPGLDRERRLQGGDGVARLMFLPESDQSVGQKQNQDDAKVRPVPGRRRQDHRRFDHPRDWTPEIGEELQKLAGLLLLDFVWPILSEPLLRLRLGQAIRRRPQFFLDLRERQGLQIVLRIRA